MWIAVVGLIAVGVGVLFVLDVVLGRSGEAGLCYEADRLGGFEFATRLIPLYLAGIGVALVPAVPALGAAVIGVAGVLYLLRHARKPGGCGP